MRRNQKGFTLVEIMIVVAIIALLAAIAIPNLLRAKISANDSMAQTSLRAMSTAAETYATGNNGSYPTSLGALTGASPTYLSIDYCDSTARAGFNITCGTMDAGTYTFTATPITYGTTGSTAYIMTIGGVLKELGT